MLDQHRLVREAWLRHIPNDSVLLGLCRGSKSRPGKGGLRGSEVIEVEGNKRVGRPPVSRLVYFFHRNTTEERPRRTDTSGVVSAR